MTLESPGYLALTLVTLVTLIGALVLAHLDAKELFYGVESYFGYIGK